MKSFDSLIAQARKEQIHCLNVAAIMLNKKHKMLLCQRALYKKIAPGIWHIPGGKVETGETITDAITRELGEELQIETLKVHSFSGVIHDYAFEKEKHRTAFVLVQAKGEITLNKENSDYHFVEFEALENYLEPAVKEYNKQVMQYALEKNVISDIS